MDAYTYRDLIETRHLEHMKRAGAQQEIYRDIATNFRAAFRDVLSWVPSHEADSIAQIPIGLALLGSINAVTLVSPDGTPVIIFDENLVRMSLDYCKALSHDAFREGDWLPESEYGKADRTQRMEWFFDNLALNFHFCGWWLDQQWRLGHLDKNRNVLYYMMWSVHIWFVLAHEVGHAVLGHLSFDEVDEHFSPLLQQKVRAFTSSHEMEFAADRYALTLLLQAELPKPFDSIPEEQLAGFVDTLFSLFAFLEGTGAVIAGRDPWSTASATHPGALDRADRLRSLHGHITEEMGKLRDHLIARVSDFQHRWPSLQDTLSISDGMENVSLL